VPEVAKLEARIDFLERRMDKVETKVDNLDAKMDEVVRFTTKIEVMFGHLSETLTKVEIKLDKFLEKNELKEEAARKETAQAQEQEISKWKTVSFEIAKWVLIILGVGTAGESAIDVVKNYFIK
jgi:predicted nuclease with TOPRIM domain